jgi:hypothetical protein
VPGLQSQRRGRDRDVQRLPDELDVVDIGHSVRCTKCRRRGGASAHPKSRLWVAHLRQSGQRHRLPYWTPMMREAEDAAVLTAFNDRRARRVRDAGPATA